MKTLYKNGNILTMEEDKPYLKSLLVENDKIIAWDDMAQAAENDHDTIIYDLQGACLLPAFIDAHSHICSFASTLETVQLAAARSFADIKAAMEAYILGNCPPKEQFIVGFGYDNNFLAEKAHPTKALLDEIAVDNPMIITHKSGHMAVANSAYLKACGITADTVDPEGGKYGRISGSREPNGYLEETAFFATASIGGAPKEADIFRQIAKAQDVYLSYGITTAQEGMMKAPNAQNLEAMAETQQLKIDIVGFVDLNEAAQVLQNNQEAKTYHHHFRLGGYKLILDGSPQGKTAWLSQPYEGSDDCAYGSYSDEYVYELLKQAIEEQEQVLVHCNGDAAAEQFITQMEKIKKELPQLFEGQRPVMIHAQTVRLDQLPRMKALGMIPSFFVEHVHQWGDVHLKNLGQARAQRISPVASAIKNDLIYTFHQDTPVLPPDMMRTIQTAVTRLTAEGVLLGEEERVTVWEALKAVTINAAYQYFEENQKGSLAVGKKADMVILSADPLKTASDKIAAIKILATIKDGMVVYQQSL